MRRSTKDGLAVLGAVVGIGLFHLAVFAAAVAVVALIIKVVFF